MAVSGWGMQERIAKLGANIKRVSRCMGRARWRGEFAYPVDCAGDPADRRANQLAGAQRRD